MDTLPTDLLKIIQNYKDQIDHFNKFKECLEDITLMSYEVEYEGASSRFNGDEEKYEDDIETYTEYLYFDGDVNTLYINRRYTRSNGGKKIHSIRIMDNKIEKKC